MERWGRVKEGEEEGEGEQLEGLGEEKGEGRIGGGGEEKREMESRWKDGEEEVEKKREVE